MPVGSHWADQQDRHGGIAHHGVGYSPEDSPSQARAAARRHIDERWLLASRYVEEERRRRVPPTCRDCLDSLSPYPGGDRPEIAVYRLADRIDDVRIGRRSPSVFVERVGRARQDDAPLEHARQDDRLQQCQLGKLRSVEGATIGPSASRSVIWDGTRSV